MDIVNPVVLQLVITGVIELLCVPIIVFVVKRFLGKRLDDLDRNREAARVAREEKYAHDKAWQESVTAGMRSLLRSKLIHEHRKAMSQGYYSYAEREYLSRVKAAYKGLDGNDIGDTLYAETIALPHEPSERAHETNERDE